MSNPNKKEPGDCPELMKCLDDLCLYCRLDYEAILFERCEKEIEQQIAADAEKEARKVS